MAFTEKTALYFYSLLSYIRTLKIQRLHNFCRQKGLARDFNKEEGEMHSKSPKDYSCMHSNRAMTAYLKSLVVMYF